jgi:hypothetical protein
MLSRPEKRSGNRMSYKHVIKYSYPSLNSGGHEKAYGLVRKFCDLRPMYETLLNRFITSGMATPLVSPKKSWTTTEDLGPDGIGILVSRGFDVGQDLLIFDEKLSHRPISARVMWCSGYGDNKFKVGLKYNETSLLPADAWSRIWAWARFNRRAA